MPTITVNVDDDLRERMEDHPEINWSEVTRQAIKEKVDQLELLDELTRGSELTEADVEEIAAEINSRGRQQLDDDPA